MAFDMPFDNAQNHRSYIVLWNRHTDAMKCINWFLLFMTQPYSRCTNTAKSVPPYNSYMHRQPSIEHYFYTTRFANFYRIVMLHGYCSIYFEHKLSGEVSFFPCSLVCILHVLFGRKEVEQLLGLVIYSNPQPFPTCIIASTSSSDTKLYNMCAFSIKLSFICWIIQKHHDRYELISCINWSSRGEIDLKTS